MIAASARIMLLSLLRDRAALAMTFLLPPVIFVIFAMIFAGATGDELRLHVGLADAARTTTTERLVAALRAEPGVRLTISATGSADEVRTLVRRGAVDIGLVLRGDLEARPEEAPAPVLVVEDAARALAAPIVIGQLQKTLNERLPDVALARVLADVERSGGIQKEERAFLEEAFRTQSGKTQDGGGFSFAALFEREAATRIGTAGGPVAYYAGAVAAVFLLFGAMQGATTIHDEREAGIYERVLGGPGALAGIIAGKFAYLTGQGVAQVALIFAAAALLYGVDVGAAFLPWLATCLLASAMAAGLALAVSALCATRRQAQMASTFGVLLLSALGGSMVPRFLMPPWLQEASWATPNAWAIDAFQTVLRPGSTLGEVGPSWAVLAALALAGLAAAATLAARRLG